MWPSILWAIFVLILCGLPGKDFPDLSFLEWLRPDKIAHLFLFGIQSLLLMIGFSRQNHFPSLIKNAVLYSLTLTILYGALVEVLQDHVFIQRSGDIRDAIANAMGAFLGYWIYKKKFQQKSVQPE